MHTNQRFIEYAVVISLGLIVALGITVFLYLRTDDNVAEVVATPTPSATPITSLPEKEAAPIEIEIPNNETVFDQKSITMTGHTFPHSDVVVFIGEKDFLLKSDDQGHFSIDLNLDSGSNSLIATVITPEGETFSDQRLVVYTNKSLEEILLTQEELEQADQASKTDES